MEFYIVLIIMAGVFAVITGLVKFFVANKVATITTGIVFGLVLLTVGLYHYLHHRYPRNYTTLRSIHQSSKKIRIIILLRRQPRPNHFAIHKKVASISYNKGIFII